MKAKFGALKAVLFASISAFSAQGVFAQDNSEQADQSNSANSPDPVIVVTAQRRESSIQEVPFAITAIGGDELEALGANGFETFADRVPGLTSSRPNPLNTQFFMRGTSSGALTFDQIQQSSTVGIYFDEVAVDVSAANPNFQLFDMNRVEVLRGPQGTIFGAGSQAGAIRLIPNQAEFGEFSAGGGLTGSFTENGDFNYSIDAGLNLPVGDSVALRVVGYQSRLGGFVDNPVSGEDDDNDFEATGVRAILSFRPSDRFDGYAMVAYQEANLDNNGAAVPGVEPLQNGNFNSTQDEALLAQLVLNYDAGIARITSVTGYIDKQQAIGADVAAFPTFFGLPAGSPIDFPTQVDVSVYSQELRVQSTSESSRFRWIVGGFFQQVDRSLVQSIIIPGIETALGFPAGPAFGARTDEILFTDFTTDNYQIAVFGEVEFDITDKLTLAVGGRYFDAEQDTVFDDRGLLLGGQFLENFVATDSGFNPNFTVDYEIDKDHRVYARAAKGFRLSGTNYFVPPGLCDADLAAINLTEVPQAFESDSLWSYELGSKNQFGRGTSLNVALYHSRWDNIQSTVALACGYNFQANLGRAEVNGAEIELAVNVNQGFNLYATFAYTDAEFKEAVPQLGVQGGEVAPFTPEIAATIGFDFVRPLGRNSSWLLSGSLQYQDERVTGVVPTTSFGLDDYVLVDLRAGVNLGNGISALVFAQNLFDERAELGRGVSGVGTTPGPFVFYARPRTVGVTVRKDF